ncbi:MAG TPA: hypothetical protein VGE43_04785, partial [Acidimicrobiales bacterium]
MQMFRSWALAVAVAVAVVTGITGAGLTVPLQAHAPSGAQAGTAGLVRAPSGADVQPLDRRGVRRYWTPKRMRQAVPLDLDRSGDQIRTDATADAAPTSGRAAEGLRSVGKLFFSDASANYVCSAAAINTPERNLVLTAGHCVNTGGVRGLLGGCRAGTYFRNFQFVPAYDNGAAPYGRWIGMSAVAPSEWINGCDVFSRDQGMIAVAPLGGANLVDTVGGNAVAWNYPQRQDAVRAVGWPAQSPYDGTTRQECTASTTIAEDGEDAQMPCPLTGGASGGPWLLTMASADTGFIFAVTSRRTTSGPALLFAVPFDDSIEALLGAARLAARPIGTRTVSSPALARRAARKQRLRISTAVGVVGYGEPIPFSVRGRRVRKAVLQPRDLPGAPWRRVGTVRLPPSGWLPITQSAPPGTHYYRVRAKQQRGRKVRSQAVAVTVLACPYPLDRSPSVVSATRCT